MKNLIAVLCLLILGVSSYGETRENVRGDDTVNSFSRYAEVTLVADKIRFSHGEDIAIRFKITNKGYRTIRVYPFAEPNRSFQFSLTDKRGREIEPLIDHEKNNKRESGDPVVSLEGEEVKEIILHPRESFERTIQLTDLYKLEPNQEYRLVGYFYPDQRFPYFARSANSLTLRIGPKKDNAPFENRPDESAQDSLMLSPEETVYLFLSAEMRRNWQNYLKYVDLRKFITAYDKYAAQYVQSREDERPEILRDFSRYLTTEPADRLKKFKILSKRDEDRAQRSFVVVEALRESAGYVVSYEYTYTLEKDIDRSGFWKIVYVTVKVNRS